MKKLIYSLALAVGLVGLTAATIQQTAVDACQKEISKEQGKTALLPYRYSGFTSKPFVVKRFNQMKETQVELLKDMPYRIIFDRYGIPDGQKVVIAVYDRPLGHKKRMEIYRNDSSEDQVILDTESLSEVPSTLFVEYEINANESTSDEQQVKGCMGLTMGYQTMMFDKK